jgi:hypothetical protein
MGDRGMTLAECEDLVDRLMEFPSDPSDVALLFATLPEQPPYVMGSMLLGEGLDIFRRSVHQCDNCDNPGCFGRVQHQQYFRETCLPVISEIEQALDNLKKELALFLFKYENCECEDCKTKDKKDAAKFN